MPRLSGKTALITGGSSGIGLASAKAMINEGARVIITGQNEERLKEAATSLGRNATGVVAPAQDLEALDLLAHKVKLDFGGLDILFCNAGYVGLGTLDDIDMPSLQNQFAVNFAGPLFAVQKLRPLLRQNSSIIFTTSCLNQLGSPGMGIYSATKAALRSLARTLSAELKDAGIRVNTVAPGPIETPIYGKLGLPEDALNEMAGSIQSQVPAGRFGKPEEIASAVVFLASNDSSYMLGEEITIDGGWSNL